MLPFLDVLQEKGLIYHKDLHERNAHSEIYSQEINLFSCDKAWNAERTYSQGSTV